MNHHKTYIVRTINFFYKSCLSDINYPITDIQPGFEINQPVRYQITAKRSYFDR